MTRLNIFLIFLSLFSFGLAQWRELKPSGPTNLVTDSSAQPPPMLSPLVWCLGSDQVYVFGGEENQLWLFEVEDKRWLWQPNPPTGVVARPNAAYWSIRGLLYWYVERDFYTYSPKTRTFSPVSYTGTLPNCTAGAFWTHQPSNRLYLWGGTCGKNVYAFDVQLNQWQHIATTNEGPEASLNAGAVLSRSESVVYLFGGDRMWELDIPTSTWTQPPNTNSPPGPMRRYMNLWQATANDYIMLFGGVAGAKVYGDLWTYNPSGKEWTYNQASSAESGSPAPRWGFSSCVNTNGYLFLFGGTSEQKDPLYNDMWQYGPYTVHNIVDQIDWKLDSATLMATWAASMSSVVFLLLLFLMVLNCVRRCLSRRRKNALQGPIVMIQNEDSFTNDL